MNKKEFLSLLEKRLKVLDENEIKDIISEYDGIIDEKVKNGIKEEEATGSFGDIDELANEILKAYKINPKYGNKEKAKQDKKEDFEETIKSWASKLAEIFKDIFSGMKKDFTVELLFEMIIKFLLLLVGLSILSLPFRLFYYLGAGILDVAFFPIDKILIFIWSILILVLYFISCGLAFAAVFKKYFSYDDVIKAKKAIVKHIPEEKRKEAEKIIAKEEKKHKKKIEEEIEQIEEELEEIEEKIEEKYEKKYYHEEKIVTTGISSVIIVIIRIAIIICLLIPCMFAIIGLYMAALISGYYACIGLNTWGITIGLIGVAMIFTYLFNVMNRAIWFRKVHTSIAPLIISAIFIFFGMILSFDALSNIKEVKGLPETDFTIYTNSYNTYINDRLIVNNCNLVSREDLDDNEVIISYEYYNELVEIDNVIITDDGRLIYDMGRIYNNRANYYKLYKLIINNLKKDRIYDYEDLGKVKTTIFANTNTVPKINCLRKD